MKNSSPNSGFSMEVVEMEPGVMPKIFDYLKGKVEQMKQHERECCLTLDEMTIEAVVQYDKSSSVLRRHVTLPAHSGTATHALVFMLGGETTRWKQTVAYYFTGNSVDGEACKPIVMDILRTLAFT